MFPMISLGKLAAVPVVGSHMELCHTALQGEQGQQEATAKAHRAKGLQEDRGSILHFLAQLPPQRKVSILKDQVK